MLAAIGMEAFAERARKELQATGETVRKRTAETRDDLTGQERQIPGVILQERLDLGRRRRADGRVRSGAKI